MSKTDVLIPDDGVGRVSVPEGVTHFGILSRPGKGKVPGGVASINCNAAALPLSVLDVQKTGFAFGKNCGDRQINPMPGEIIFWALARPLLDFQ